MLAGIFASSALLMAAPASRENPNVVLILADDLGWSDLGVAGSDLYKTPHIDGLARDGMSFTNAYSASAVCSPTRAALLTGMYPARLHITNWIPGRNPSNGKMRIPQWTKYLDTKWNTLAARFKEAGYITASIGKWHLGKEPYYPEKHGFDINVAGTHSGAPTNGYFAPHKISTLSEGPKGEYLTDRIGQEVLQFVEANKDRRFFLYYPLFAVHTPIQAPAELVEKYKDRIKPGMRHANAGYAAMIESMDNSIGALRAKLRELNLDENTIIVFTSDNGGLSTVTSNEPYRAGKSSPYEGGVRVPLIMHWPGVTTAGSLSDTPTITMDIFPTLLEAVGLPERMGEGSDGVSLTPLFKEGGHLSREALYWHYPHYQIYMKDGAPPYGAILCGDYRLVEFYDDMRVELYKLSDDIGETKDLSRVDPEITDKLRKMLHAWRSSVGAQMPTPNSDYDPSLPEYWKGKEFNQMDSF